MKGAQLLQLLRHRLVLYYIYLDLPSSHLLHPSQATSDFPWSSRHGIIYHLNYVHRSRCYLLILSSTNGSIYVMALCGTSPRDGYWML